MYATWKNLKVLIDGSGIYANEARVSLATALEPLFLTPDKGTFLFNANNNIAGILDLTYALTGIDPIKRYITTENIPISGNLGGLYFTSGYLKSYNINCIPNNPVFVNAQIEFFDGLSGRFIKTYEPASGTYILNYGDISLFDTTNKQNLGSLSGISNLSINFEADIQPLYHAGDQLPTAIIFGSKEMTANFLVDIYSGDLPITGREGGVQVIFNHPKIPNLVENIAVSGVLYAREISTSVGNLLQTRLYIRQAFADPRPTVTSVSSFTAAPNSVITINGDNLRNTTQVRFHRRKAASFSITSNTALSVTVPIDVISGGLFVVTPAGEIEAGLFNPTHIPLTITKIQPISGLVSGKTHISGTNFYEISEVWFSAVTPGDWTGASGFYVRSSGLIEAIIPREAAWGPIVVRSSGRNISGQSTERFVPIPTFLGFNPVSGLSGAIITMSGWGFSGITGVLFNNLPNIEPFTASFGVINNTGITGQVPTGNVRGVIKLLARSGISVTSNINFTPIVRITGLFPSSGRTGTAITISGENFFQDLLHAIGSQFMVTFPTNATGLFIRTNISTLTGLIPYASKSGIPRINYNHSATYPSNITFFLINEPATITGVSPKSGVPSGYVDILGTNLFDVSAVKVSGLEVITTITNPTPIASALGDTVSMRLPNNLTGDLYTVIVETTIGANATGNALLTILDDPIFSGFTPISGAFGQKITVTGKYLYASTQVHINITGTSGESGAALVDSGDFLSNNSRVGFYIPPNANTGFNTIIVFNQISYASGTGLRLISRPSISGFNPLSGEWGTGISITGSFLNNVTGVKVGSGLSPSFTIIGTTGITFTVPENSTSDVVTVLSIAGSGSSTGKLEVHIPFHTFSGFTPLSGYIQDRVIFSGARLQTVFAVLFSGGSNTLSFNSNYFTSVDASGINMLIPYGTTGGKIGLKSTRGIVTSSESLRINPTPSISGFTPYYGAHNDTISISGSNLSATTFWFISPNSGKFVKGLNITTVGNTGANVDVPREIIKGAILVSGDSRRFGSSTGDFVPLPTISGILQTGVQTGDTIQFTGINATSLKNLIFITGSGTFGEIISGNLTLDITNASGAGIIDQTSGYTLITGRVNSSFIDSGNLFVIHSYFTSITNTATFLTSDISNKASTIKSPDHVTIKESGPSL